MSMHEKPLTPLEREGLKAHGLPRARPSQLSDAFRQGVAWALAGSIRTPDVCIGHIDQRRSMNLPIGAPITNVVWDIPYPELKHLPHGAKLYLHSAAQTQDEPEVHTMKSVMAAICSIDGFPMLTSNQCHSLAEVLNKKE